MIMTFILEIAITIINAVMGLISLLLPPININQLTPYIDDLIEIERMGLTGFRFLVGDIGITLAAYALAIYISYYSILIIYEIVTKIFLKGQ